MSQSPRVVLVGLVLITFHLEIGRAEEISVPAIPGLTVTAGETVGIPGVDSVSVAHQFEDGRISIHSDTGSVWSADGGRTWTAGPAGPDAKTVVNLGDGEVLSIAGSSAKGDDGLFRLFQKRSTDNGQTFAEETAILDTPLATSTGGDDGGHHAGLIMHHGALRLKNGDLLATMYGNYTGDNIPADGYPEEFKFFKYRTVAVFSSDNGRSWGRPVTVAYDRQLARGTDPDSSVQTISVVPAVTQEGFCEADVTRAPNGDLICAMRSGGRLGVRSAPIFPTPLYVSRSMDEGQTWTPPVQAADRGVSPYLVTLENGVIVCAYARPGCWLIFSDDNGQSWKGSFQFGTSDSYCNVFAVGPDEILVLYYSAQRDPVTRERTEIDWIGTFFTVQRR
jgi:hypothetical protein